MIIPFYTSSGRGNKYGPDGKTLHGVGNFFPFWGVHVDTHWLNKSHATWKIEQENIDVARTNEDRTMYYGSAKLAIIGRKLDELLPGYDKMNDYYKADRNESSRGQYGMDNYKKQLNQGFTKNGIEPAKITEHDILYANIRASKKIIGLGEPGEEEEIITYKLVPFSNGKRFGRQGTRYFVLVDINPAFRQKDKPPPEPPSETRELEEDIAYRADLEGLLKYAKASNLWEPGKVAEIIIDEEGNPKFFVGRKEIVWDDEYDWKKDPINWNLSAYNPGMSLEWNDAEAQKTGAPLPRCKKCGDYHDRRLECPVKVKVATFQRQQQQPAQQRQLARNPGGWLEDE